LSDEELGKNMIEIEGKIDEQRLLERPISLTNYGLFERPELSRTN
jgi:hypothetical protein